MKNDNYSMYSLNGQILIGPDHNSARITHVPPFVYELNYDEESDVTSLTFIRKEFAHQQKRYGRSKIYENVIVKDYLSMKSPSLGVILMGRKGSGKSMLAESICNQLLENKVPVIYIKKPTHPTAVDKALALIGPCVVYIDEFEKNFAPKMGEYGPEFGNQNFFLSIFSDTSISGVMFIITFNDIGLVTPYILDRPGRFKYCIKFKSIEPEGIKELVEEHKLVDWQAKILSIYAETHSYDVLRQVITYLKKANTPVEFLKLTEILNVGGELIVNPDRGISLNDTSALVVDGKPFTGTITISLHRKDDVLNDDPLYYNIRMVNTENIPTTFTYSYKDIFNVTAYSTKRNEAKVMFGQEPVSLPFSLELSDIRSNTLMERSNQVVIQTTAINYSNGFIVQDMSKWLKSVEGSKLFDDVTDIHPGNYRQNYRSRSNF